MYLVSDGFLRAVKSNTRKYYWTGTIVTRGGMTYEFGSKEIEPHWGQTPLLLWETFGRFLFLCLKFEKSLYNLNTMEKVFIRF